MFAVIQIMEPQVLVRCREADLALVEHVLPEDIAEYTKALNKPCAITVAKDNFLPANWWVENLVPRSLHQTQLMN